ncbi:hypothetical protein [Peptoniphilus sp.]|jgi:hypothetical protein|uniref:hypothetical protein n=1 Tax=Peptoniphilus sp. TaxID=1971214 RepID=UPI003D94E3BF
MKLIDNELVDRYIYYFLRYIPYDKQEEAKEDMLKEIEKNLPRDYSDRDITRALNKLGNPYQFAAYYTKTGHFLISGKTYEVFKKFLKLLLISSGVGLVLFFFNYFSRLVSTGVYNVLKSLAISIFILSVLPSWISEKIKTTRILKSLTNEWDTTHLYETKKVKIKTEKIALVILSYSMFFMLQMYIITSKIDITTATYTLIMFMFFLNVLKDNMKVSENNVYSRIVYTEYVIDAFTIICFTILTKFFIPDLFIIKTIIFTSVVNIIMNVIGMTREKKNKKASRRSRREER